MPDGGRADETPPRLRIYPYYKALDALAADPGLRPRHLVTVMFPLHRVLVRAVERPAVDYEELELLVVQAMHQLGLASIDALHDFYRLDRRLLRQIVGVMITRGLVDVHDRGRFGPLLGLRPRDVDHLDGARLALSPLGRRALRRGYRRDDVETAQVLYFDAYACRPLPGEVYKDRVFFAPADLDGRDLVLFSDRPWDPEALRELARRRDKLSFGVNEEVRSLEPLHDDAVRPAYVSMHIALAKRGDADEVCAFLDEAAYRKRRTPFFEAVVRDYSDDILKALLTDPRPVRDVIMQAGLAHALAHRGIPHGTWSLAPPASASDGWTALVDWDRLPDVPRSAPPSAGAAPHATLALGGYALAGRHCVRIWCERDAPRREVASEGAVRAAGRFPDHLPLDVLRREIDATFAALEAGTVDIEDLLTWARRTGAPRAAERLASLL